MTWYANEIIARATPEVLKAVRADPLLAPFAYHVTNLRDFEWPDPEVAHQLPPEGLLIIRPLCNPMGQEPIMKWLGVPFIDWRMFPDHGGIAPLISREYVAAELAIAIDEIPTVGMLACVKKLAVTTGMPFVFYSCFMFIGDVEWEYAWVFREKEREKERVIICQRPKVEGFEEVAILKTSDEIQLAPDDTLKMALIYLSVYLITSFFAPHTRAFPWEKYKLVPSG